MRMLINFLLESEFKYDGHLELRNLHLYMDFRFCNCNHSIHRYKCSDRSRLNFRKDHFHSLCLDPRTRFCLRNNRGQYIQFLNSRIRNHSLCRSIYRRFYMERCLVRREHNRRYWFRRKFRCNRWDRSILEARNTNDFFLNLQTV